jgi:hypothetical protein
MLRSSKEGTDVHKDREKLKERLSEIEFKINK